MNGYWYDTSKKCFYIPNENKFIKISAEEVLVIIDYVNLFKWNSYKIFNKTIWKSDITQKIIDVFIREYQQGLFDDVLEWICINNIECNNVDKTDYLYSFNK